LKFLFLALVSWFNVFIFVLFCRERKKNKTLSLNL
jgi:hypothetical protein